MKSNARKFMTALIVLAMILSMATVAFAAEASFSKKAVDSNEWCYITSAKKGTTSDYASLYISNLYKADGSASGYSQVYAKATYNGTSTIATKGYTVQVSIPSGYRAAGNSVSLYLMGHDPSLDCQASGTWNVN